MKKTRLLLPFTQCIDMEAIAYAVRFAKKSRAILLPLALIPLSQRQWSRGPRLEAIEQANDFLEAVRYQAAWAGVPLEPSAFWTCNVVSSLRLFAQEMLCKGIFLFVKGDATVLLPPEVVRALLEQIPCTLYLVSLQRPSGVERLHALWQWCSQPFRHWRGRQGKAQQKQRPTARPRA